MNKNFPSYIADKNFNQSDLNSFIKTGDIENERDSFGNIFIKTENETQESDLGDYYISVPLGKKKLIPEQIDTFYNTQINEFATIKNVDGSDDSQLLETEDLTLLADVEAEIDEQKLLQAQIDELSNKLDEEMEKTVKFTEDANETFRASKDIIISQRIAAGEGISPDDFSDVFPFLPLSEEEKNKPPSIESFPFSSS